MRDFATSADPTVQAQLDRLAQLSVPQGRFGLETIRALLARLGEPQRRLPPAFHVAGTNGKGSTCAFLRAALEAAGCRVHAFTSPHLVRFNERIRLAGRLIEDAPLAALLGEVLDAAEGLAPSFFEATTAAAFLAFARQPAEACVIEVGLGGRLDATNALEAPAACGIASLGIDHEAFLLAPEAGTPEAPAARIAWEKAGIAKPGAPLLTLAYPEAAADAIRAAAQSAGAELLPAFQSWSYRGDDGCLVYRDHAELRLPLPTLPGAHQADNYALAVAMLRHQDRVEVPPGALAAAATAARWPARLQRLAPGPLTALAPGRTIWLDGGHNRDAGEAIAAHFAAREPIHLILGMLANKDPGAIVEPLAPRLASLAAVPVPGHEAHAPEIFRALAERHAIPFRAAADPAEGLCTLPGPGDVLIAGSLYLAGAVLEANEEYPD